MIRERETAMGEDLREWTYDALVAEGLDPKRYEIVDGIPREVSLMSREGARIAVRLGHFFEVWLDAHQHGPGFVLSAGRYTLREQPRRQERLPDLSYLARDRLPPDDPWPITCAPDLAVEVRPASDSVTELKRKLERDYFPAGTREGWIVDPDLQNVTVLRPGASPRTFDRDDVLESEVLPGFRVALEELFRVLD